jgi:hypothetical protein
MNLSEVEYTFYLSELKKHPDLLNEVLSLFETYQELEAADKTARIAELRSNRNRLIEESRKARATISKAEDAQIGSNEKASECRKYREQTDCWEIVATVHSPPSTLQAPNHFRKPRFWLSQRTGSVRSPINHAAKKQLFAQPFPAPSTRGHTPERSQALCRLPRNAPETRLRFDQPPLYLSSQKQSSVDSFRALRAASAPGFARPRCAHSGQKW